MKKMRGGWKDVRGNGNKQVQVSTILGLCCLFLCISTLMLLCPAQEWEHQHTECSQAAAGGCAENMGRVKHTSAVFPNSCNILSEKSLNAKFTLLRHCFVINFILYEPLCLWRTVKQNEEGNQT